MSFGRLRLGDIGKLGSGGKSSSAELPGIISARTGSFTFIGDAMAPLVGYWEIADVGDFAETGVAAGFLYNRVMPEAAGSFTMTGQDSSLTKATSYTAVAVNFDGTNDYLTRGAGLTGAADGKLGSISFWFKFNGGDGVTQRIFDMNSGGTRVAFQKRASNDFSITLRNASATDLLGSGQSITTYTSAMSAWAHCCVSWDVGNNAFNWFVDGSSVKSGSTTVTNGDIDYTVSNAAIGASIAAAEKINCDLSEFWFATEYIDFSVQANREKFRSAAGKPVSLGANGSTPTGTQPLIYLANALSTWKTNLGSGGGFTENGALTSAATSPSD